jgi:carbon monoxide dehydrogenase subunit G
MKISGEATLPAPARAVWDALLDPAVLVRTLPGCERLETLEENHYSMTVNVGVAAIKGAYSGSCRLSDLKPYESLVLSAQGSGAPGTISADIAVRFQDNADDTTTLTYDADAIVGGMIGGVGQRMLTSVSKRMAGEFFGAVEEVLAGGGLPAEVGAPGAPGAPAGQPGVYTAPPKPARAGAGSSKDFVTGLSVGAALVALGVVLGALAGRKR